MTTPEIVISTIILLTFYAFFAAISWAIIEDYSAISDRQVALGTIFWPIAAIYGLLLGAKMLLTWIYNGIIHDDFHYEKK